MTRVNIKPDLIRWACERSGAQAAALAKRFPRLEQWMAGAVQPTMGQLEGFAKATLTPLGYFFLTEPPPETLPVPDFRTVKDRPLKGASAALLETIYTMQRRQSWLRDYLIEDGENPLPFIGSVTLATSPELTAAAIRKTLGMVDGWAEEHATWEKALLGLRRTAETAGVLVVINGVFGNNTHQKLNPEEFRGFVLCDAYAPLIFINGADAKSAQMFTLAHESWLICGLERMGSSTCPIWKSLETKWKNSAIAWRRRCLFLWMRSAPAGRPNLERLNLFRRWRADSRLVR